MRASILLISQVLAASFIKWPEYQGRRDNLERLVSLFGIMEGELNQSARTLDELATDDQLMLLTINIRQKDAWKAFGSLLVELSPARLDAFCDKLQPPYVDLFLADYPDMNSRWKHQVSLLHTANGLNCQALDLKDLLSTSLFWKCASLLPKDQLVSAITTTSLLPKFSSIPSNLFEDRADDYLTVLEKCLSAGGQPKFIVGIFNEQQYAYLASLLRNLNPLNRPKVKDYNPAHKDWVDAVNEEGIFMENYGLDATPFEGESPIPSSVKNIHLQAYRDNQPLPIYPALKVAYAFGNLEMLAKSVSLARQASARVDFIFLEWLKEPHVFNDRVVQMFDCVMPTPPDQIPNWTYHLIPLYRAILNKPVGFYTEQIRAWAQKSLADLGDPTEDDLMITYDDMNQAQSAACFAIRNGWKKLLGRVDGLFRLPFFEQALPLLSQVLTNDRLLKYVKPAIPSLVVTANFNLLELFINLGLSPDSIWRLTGNPLLQRRLTLMLQLVPGVKLHNEFACKFDKNSKDFSEWLSQQINATGLCAVGDKKMLQYYSINRSMLRYH